jgi:phosphoribosyl 1,2-cyclic phosphodiesterase
MQILNILCPGAQGSRSIELPAAPPVGAAAVAAGAAQAATSERFSAILLGTGASNRVPRLDHVLSQDCAVCAAAMSDRSRDRRNNVSLALLCRGKTVMIDAGKTMYSACTRFFPSHGIKTVHAILLTHGHADAILGLDDVRELQKMERVSDADGNAVGFRLVGDQTLMPIITNQKTIDEVKRQFPYLATPPIAVPGQPSGVMSRKVAALEFQSIEDNTERVPNIPGDLPIRTFPVFHGGTYISLGFAIGGPLDLSRAQPADSATSTYEGLRRPHYPLVYISDIKGLPSSSKCAQVAPVHHLASF